jgi:hypothetical protein
MTETFVTKFLQVAREVTAADRGMAVDMNLKIQAVINLDEATLKAPRFSNLAEVTLRQALDENAPILTNNIVTTPEEAPRTNTTFSDLRVVVAIPVPEMGAVYLDQPIRHGMIPREVMERLSAMVQQVIAEGQTDLSKDELIALYKRSQV